MVANTGRITSRFSVHYDYNIVQVDTLSGSLSKLLVLPYGDIKFMLYFGVARAAKKQNRNSGANEAPWTLSLKTKSTEIHATVSHESTNVMEHYYWDQKPLELQ
eukprot:2604824-Pleurochrysis_carterae.AAC.1